jgi:hypothetical protein
VTPDLRVALYYAPALDDPLSDRAANWLGRDPETDARRPQPELPNIEAITADPRLYGFHATLKPPMRLREGTRWDDVMAAVERIAGGVPAFDMPPLAVADLHGFLALREAVPSPELQGFADLCVAALDAFRQPPDEAELARRRRGGLSPACEAMLVQWGYPYVFATWFFHMTLTRRLRPEEHAIYLPAARAHFADVLPLPRRAADLCVFTQRAPGAAFTIAQRVPLRG